MELFLGDASHDPEPVKHRLMICRDDVSAFFWKVFLTTVFQTYQKAT